MTLVLTLVNLSGDFSKITIVILFIYLLIAFYLFQFYVIDSKESYYYPQFSEDDFFPPMLYNIEVDVLKDGQVISSGKLTNWSEEGCFAYLNEKSQLKGLHTLKIYFQERVFYAEFSAVTSMVPKNRGHGFKINNVNPLPDKKMLGWGHFCEIIDDMGLKAEYLK